MSRWKFGVGVLGLLCLALSGGCPMPGGSDGGMQQGCAADDPRVGRTAVLSTRAHAVSGTARIVDNCTLAIDNFSYDGGGPNVRVYLARDTNYAGGISISADLSGRPYTNEMLTLPLPNGVSLDDAVRISIWCADFDVNFGDGEFQ
ncbi:MAG: DM13 domain-containing protein [Phycisphaerae bacterium]